MKVLGKLQSNRGHKKMDYLISLSEKEFTLFKQLVTSGKKIVGRDNTTQLSLKSVFGKIKLPPNSLKK